MINDDGTLYVANLRGSQTTTLQGAEGGETFEPAFAHTVSYELTGLAVASARRSDWRRLQLRCARGRSWCSDPMLSQLWRNIRGPNART
jgi:hypothetical protein